ncbi:MAG: hypothetical protein M0003_10005 [Acidithiobacillus sp.]|jgi:hypothetical protein|nr:hypothetical protein [Acidithiobacillus sp.]
MDAKFAAMDSKFGILAESSRSSLFASVVHGAAHLLHYATYLNRGQKTIKNQRSTCRWCFFLRDSSALRKKHNIYWHIAPTAHGYRAIITQATSRLRAIEEKLYASNKT